MVEVQGGADVQALGSMTEVEKLKRNIAVLEVELEDPKYKTRKWAKACSSKEYLLACLHRRVMFEKRAVAQAAQGVGRPGVGGTGGSGAAGRLAWYRPLTAQVDEAVKQLGSRIARVMLGAGQDSGGTVVRISPEGLCLTARRVLVDRTQFLDAQAWGEPLKFIASAPRDGIIIVQGAPGDYLEFPSANLLQQFRPVLMGTYPLTTDKATANQNLEHPVVCEGQIDQYTNDLKLAAASYASARPLSLGGAVLYTGRTLAGIHTGSVYHCDTEVESKPVGAQEKKQPMVLELERDVGNLLDLGPGAANALGLGGDATLEDKRGMSLQQAQQAFGRLTLYNTANLCQTADLALYVPVCRIVHLLKQAGAVPLEDLDVWRLSNAYRRGRIRSTVKSSRLSSPLG